MNLIVIAEIVISDTKENDLFFRVASPNKGFSHLFCLKGKGDTIDSNPYSVYGPSIAAYFDNPKWKNHEWVDATITVAHVHSGSIIEYVEVVR
jgi:hypothetical protein